METPATPSEQNPNTPSDGKEGKRANSGRREIWAGILIYVSLLALSLFCILFTRHPFNHLPSWVAEFQASLREGTPKEFKAKSDVYADEPFAFVLATPKTHEVVFSQNALQRTCNPYFILDSPKLLSELKDQKEGSCDFFEKILSNPSQDKDGKPNGVLRHLDVAGAANVVLFPYGKHHMHDETVQRLVQYVQAD